jgi:hypothetical protein
MKTLKLIKLNGSIEAHVQDLSDISFYDSQKAD